MVGDAKKSARGRVRKRNTTIIFVNGKQKRIKGPDLIDNMPVAEFIARNADPVWLHQHEMWEYIMCDKDKDEPQCID